MIGRLVLGHLALHPIRSLVFVGAYAAGVSVMLALLSIGEVMVAQSREEQWVGGGEITVLPAGVELETLRTGGAAFFGIEGARFIARAVLGGPRLADRVEAVAPWISDRAVYLRRDGQTAAVAVRASAMIPSAARALGAPPELLSGVWVDSEADRRWLRPTRFELYSEIDRFHFPPERVKGDTTWAEWHYFNLLWPDEQRWLYLSYILGGDLQGKRWGGMVLARYRGPDGRHHSFADTLGSERVRFSTLSPDLSFGPHTVRLLDEPVRYAIKARLPATDDGAPLEVDLEIFPEPHRYFPPAQLAATGSFLSGYVVPALRARAAGRVCWERTCQGVESTIAYHDHNWGTWGGVIWDWGVAHAEDFDLLYGGVHGGDEEAVSHRGGRFLGYVVDSLGVAGVVEPEQLTYSGRQLVAFDADTVAAPRQLTWSAAQGPDSLAVRIELARVALSRLALGGDRSVYFAQMQGRLALTGVLGDRPLDAVGPGFFETYLTREPSRR